MTDRYYAMLAAPLRGWQIRDRLNEAEPVDIARSSSVAEYEVNLLNAGMAHVNPHGLLGCRVELGAA